MTSQNEFTGERIKECGKGGDHEFPNVFSYALKAAQHIESREGGFIEAYRNSNLRLELYFRSIDNEVSRNLSQDLPIAYRFSGLIGPQYCAAYVDEIPDKRSVQRGESEHVVLVAIRELVKVHQWVPGPSLGLHLIRLEPLYSLDGSLMNPVESPLAQCRDERISVDADWIQVLERGDVAIAPHQCIDDVIQGGAEIVNGVSRYCGEFEGWVSHHLKSQRSASAIACIALGQNLHVRSIVQVQQGFGLEPIKVVVRIPQLLDHASERVVQ